MKDSIDVYTTPKVLTAATESNSNIIQVDLTTKSWTELSLQCELLNDAPAPFNSRGIFVTYGFSDSVLNVADAPSLLDKTKKIFTILTNSTENSTKVFNSGPIRILGDYFYMWVSHGDLGNDVLFTTSLIDVSTGSGGGGGGSSSTTEATQLNVLTQVTAINNKVATQSTLSSINSILSTLNTSVSKDSSILATNAKLGNITDSSVIDHTTAASIIAVLKGLLRMYADVWDSNTHTFRSYMTTKLDPVNDSVSIHNGTTAIETTTSITSSTSVVTLMVSNALRKGLTVFNNADQPMYIKHGSGAATTSFKVKVAAGGLYVMPVPLYTGIVTGIWTGSPTGAAMVCENTL
jgi:hypothetical protein